MNFLIIILLTSARFGNCWIIETIPTDENIAEYGGNSVEETQKERLNIIFPGTKWCGSGSVAENPDDLGQYHETDACCRMHDQCEDIIQAMEIKYNLTNPTFFTRVHCSCDEKFYDCLHGSSDEIGGKIGILYFSLLDTKCFRNDYPILGCKRHTKFPRRCLEYELDESQPKIYQWFDVPLYR